MTIHPDGSIYLNRKTYDQLGRPEAVDLYYSVPRQAIAIQPANARLARTFPVKKRSTGGGVIYAMRLLRHHKIKVTGAESFTRPEIDREGILHLNLTETTGIGGWEHPASGKTRAEREAEKQAAREKREAERHKRQLLKAQEHEERAREREKKRKRREVERKNAAELKRRQAHDEKIRKEYYKSRGLPVPDTPQPTPIYRSGGF